MASKSPAGHFGGATNSDAHGHSHAGGTCHGHGHGHPHGHSHAHGQAHDGDEGRGAAGSKERVLEKLRNLLEEEAVEEQEVEEEELDWSVVTCPNLHALKMSEDERHPWSCDMARYRDREPTERAEEIPPWKRFHKNRYGIKQSERWNCLSGYVSFQKHRNERVFHCWTCNFSICEACYLRAEEAGKRVESVKALLNAQDATCAWMKSKLMVVGQARVGKTATVRALLGREFVQDLESTVGVSLSHVKAAEQGLRWQPAKAEAKFGHAVTAAVTKVIANSAGTDKEHQSLEGSHPASGEEGRRVESHTVPLDKKDMERVKILGSFDLEVFPESSKEKNVLKYTVWDFSGQTVFYSLHQLFLTSYGIYLVVFNCVDLVNEPTEALTHICHWLSSVRIHAAAAPIFLVGTHTDCLKNEATDVAKVNKQLISATRGFAQVVTNREAQLEFFPISNAQSKGIVELCSSIEKVSRDQQFLQLQVPIRWLRCLDKMIKNDTRSWISREEIRKEAKKLGIHRVAEFEEMLKLFHELGVIVHLTTTLELDKVVVVNPQWLLDEISKLIRDFQAHPYKKRELDEVGLSGDWERLKADAVCTFDYLHWLWGFERVGFFVDLLQATMLLSQWTFDGTKDKHFLVPSLVKASKRNEIRTAGWPTCGFDFSGLHLPDGTFQRLICLFVDYCSGHSPSSAPVISKTWASFEFDGEEAIEIFVDGDALSLAVNSPSVSSKYLAVLTSMVRKVNLDAMGGSLSWKMFYVDSSNNRVSSADARKQQLKPWFQNDSSVSKETRTTPTPAYSVSNLDAFLDS